MQVPEGKKIAGKWIDFRQRARLATEQDRGDGGRLDPAESPDGPHRPRLSATDQTTDPIVSSAPITGSMSDAWT